MSQANLERLKSNADRATEVFLRQWPADADDGLYAPIHYLMSLGGKRLRAVLALSAAEAEGQDHYVAMPAALAVELFHNFTLMHDDIMDEAPLRRGQQTVHHRWDSNAAILSGDAMFTLASIALTGLNASALPAALQLFNRTALEVCIGQQSDMAFESRENVTLDDYWNMIRLKTSVLVAASLALGAQAAGATETRAALWYQLGEQLGLAFQMQDDLLDAFGTAATGKQLGGDILSDKKTFLRIHAWENASAAQRLEMNAWNGKEHDPDEKVAAIKTIMVDLGSDRAASQRMAGCIEAAEKCMDTLELKGVHREWFEFVAGLVTTRQS
ncbi:MAG: polyprenyl synthetase family protein [Bacteroidetes bacterium]|nr:polyprenyl synthetase family protein [Bacteroidota bacterium]